jgi:hypothetical protein
LSSTHDINYWWYSTDTNKSFTFYPGMRHDVYGDYWFSMIQERKQLLQTDESLRKREFAFLPGLLWKWHTLYKQFPPSDSWVWTSFPDRLYWRAMVAQHGIKALDQAWAEFPRSTLWYEFTKNESAYIPPRPFDFEGRQC